MISHLLKPFVYVGSFQVFNVCYKNTGNSIATTFQLPDNSYDWRAWLTYQIIMSEVSLKKANSIFTLKPCFYLYAINAG